MLNESPEDDARRSDIAERFIDAARSHLYHRENPLMTIPALGVESPALTTDEFEPPAILSRGMIIFFDDDRPYSGRASSVYNDPHYRYAIFIKVMDATASPRDLSYQLSDRKTNSTLRHELQHVLDKIRRKRKIIPSDDQKSNADDGPEKYYNSASELNAYFHNVAEPLLERIRFLQKHGFELEAIFPPLEKDFRKWFADRIANLHGPERSFWKWLSENNKRKVIKRLEKLHSHYFKLNKAIQAKYSEE